MQPRKIALAALLIGAITVVPLAAKAQAVQPETGALGQVPATAPEPANPIQETTHVVTGFKFSGNTAFEADELQKGLVSKIGVPLDAKDIQADVAVLQKVYKDKGMAARVESATQDETGVVSFTLVEAKVSQVKLSGLVKVDESQVRPLITSQPNGLFQATKTNADMQRCADSHLFTAVSCEVETDPNVEGGIILTFKFTEKDAPANIQ